MSSQLRCAATSDATPSNTTDANVAPWRSEAICGAQWHSVAISGNLWRSVALRGAQWQSVAISGKARRLQRYLLIDASLALVEHALTSDEGE